MDMIQTMARRGRQGFGGGGGGKPPNFRWPLAGSIALAVAVVILPKTLFNVDGGHRAIKYRRISGVSKEIFGEGVYWGSEIPRAVELS